ncbi:SPRY-domain-containing protein [Exidia glandulosa HHB12029]|uniref:SPRY-domain-containing protein n=1 Tax=Exidia glandulosa HHB12029 TaxID=1314781 RepID=A0A165PCR5_EXIGL|nr:SPRY-domain-containing protein [Exidia glandulosa HHB12029]
MPPPAPPPSTLPLPREQTMPLPTRWSDADRLPQLTVSADGRDLTFHGPTGTVDEAAAARANHPIPPACGIYYYEVEILNRGRQGHISIGFSAKNVKLTRLPGWEGLSWGYHGDDGRTFADQRTGTQYGPTFTTGDRVGCGIDFAQGRAFFTKNGRFIDYVFQDLEGGPGRELYPSVGLRSTEESIRANFGQEPFQFDIVSHVQQQRNATWARIQATPFKWDTPLGGTFTVEAVDTKPKVAEAAENEESANLSARVNDLILGYLTHHGYAGTARAFKAQTQAKAAAASAAAAAITGTSSGGDNDTDTQARQRIYHAVLAGDMDHALDETRAHYPAVLDRERGLMYFKLRCRKFGEMIIEAAEVRRRQQQAQAREQLAAQRRMDEVAQGVLLEEEEEDDYQEEDSMDVDDDAMHTSTNGHAHPHSNGAATTGAVLDTAMLKGKMKATDSEMEMQRALEYGRALNVEYASDMRPEVQELFRRTSVLWAFDSPREQGGALTEYASQAARAELANELNQAILESQGKPAQPALERLYRHTEACIMTLGAIGVGAAAFADMHREFLEN